MGGQLIGGADDLSATYYNPGALALRNESSYLLSTESFQWETVSTTPTAGLAIFDTSSSHLGAAPSLLAGVLPRWLGEDTHLAWSFLTRQDLDVRLGQRLTDPIAGAAESAAESYFDQDASEMWAGLTAARPLSESIGVGLTWYGVYRGQRLRNELNVLAVGANGGSRRRWASPTSSTRTTAPWPSSAFRGGPRNGSRALHHHPEPRVPGQR